MKKILTGAILFLSCLNIQADHQISVGIRGGAENLIPKPIFEATSTFSPKLDLDLRYTYYGEVANNTFIGISTGASLGWAKSKTNGSFENSFVNRDFLNQDIAYTTSAEFSNISHRLNLEIPVFFSLRASGFILRLGPKLQFTPWNTTRQTLINPVIDAYYSYANVHVVNEVITGVVSEQQLSTLLHGELPAVQLGAGVEIGYEWQIDGSNQLGLTAYFDYGLWNNHRAGSNPVIAVSAISDPVYPVPEVTVNCATTSAVKAYHPLQLGATIYYAFTTDSRGGNYGRGHSISRNRSRSRSYGRSRGRNSGRRRR